jgi:hypothetical protein
MKTTCQLFLAFRGSTRVPGAATTKTRERPQAFQEEKHMQAESEKTPTGPRQPLKEKLGSATTRMVHNVRKWAQFKRQTKTGE